MIHPCSMGHLLIRETLCEITETTRAECPSCGWIGTCEQIEDGAWRLPLHKRLMAKDEDTQLPLPDRLKIVWHIAPGHVGMASASEASTYQIRSQHTYCHWEMTSVRHRPSMFKYWTDESLINAPKSTFL